MSKLLIVIPTLGQRNDWLRLSISSIQHQYVEGVTVIVVGPSGTAAEPLARGLGVAYVPFDHPGQSAAINQIWKTVGGDYEYFGWLGDDDLLSPISLVASLTYLDRHLACAAVYGRIRVIGADGSTHVTMRPGRIAQALLPYTVNHVPQPGSVFRADAVRRVGYLDESLGYAMDQDLFLKLRKIATLDYLPVELGAIRAHPGTVTANRSDGDREETMVRERSWTPHQARRHARFQPLLSTADRIYSSVLRRMPMGEPPSIDGRDYVRSEPSHAGHPTQPSSPSVVTSAGQPASRPVWKVGAIWAESFVVRAAVRGWDATAARWDRARRLPPTVLAAAQASESGRDLSTASR